MKVKYKGWLNSRGEDQSYSGQTEIVGTTSVVLGLEAIRITTSDNNIKAVGKYKLSDRVESNGWSNDDEWLGATGFGHHLEWLELKLVGQDSEKYDLYYEVHVSGGGWLGFVKNGARAGNTHRIQAFRAWITERN